MQPESGVSQQTGNLLRIVELQDVTFLRVRKLFADIVKRSDIAKRSGIVKRSDIAKRSDMANESVTLLVALKSRRLSISVVTSFRHVQNQQTAG